MPDEQQPDPLRGNPSARFYRDVLDKALRDGAEYAGAVEILSRQVREQQAQIEALTAAIEAMPDGAEAPPPKPKNGNGKVINHRP